MATVLTVVAMAGCAGPASEDEVGDSTGSSDVEPSPSGDATTDETSDPPTPSAPSSTAPTPGSTSETTEPAEVPAGPTLAVTIDGDDVGPNAAEIDLETGETLVITFETDRGGQLHVHSKPEQYVDFGPGSTTKELVVTTPGTVEVEEHDSETVVAVLQVS